MSQVSQIPGDGSGIIRLSSAHSHIRIIVTVFSLVVEGQVKLLIYPGIPVRWPRRSSNVMHFVYESSDRIKSLGSNSDMIES